MQYLLLWCVVTSRYSAASRGSKSGWAQFTMLFRVVICRSVLSGDGHPDPLMKRKNGPHGCLSECRFIILWLVADFLFCFINFLLPLPILFGFCFQPSSVYQSTTQSQMREREMCALGIHFVVANVVMCHFWHRISPREYNLPTLFLFESLPLSCWRVCQMWNEDEVHFCISHNCLSRTVTLLSVVVKHNLFANPVLFPAVGSCGRRN